MLWSEPNPIPKCDTSPNVGLCPTIPQNAAGMRMEPPWSPPKAMSTSPPPAGRAPPGGGPPVPVLWVGGLGGRAVAPIPPAGPKAAAQAVHDVFANDGAPRLQHSGDHSGVEVRDKTFESKGAEAH